MDKAKRAKVTRKEDGIVKEGKLSFIEFDEVGRYKDFHLEPKVGYAIILDGHRGVFFTWMTTTITEIISQTEVKTKNSTYTIEYEL